MSDLSFKFPDAGWRVLESLGQPVGFQPDARFGTALPVPVPEPEPEPEIFADSQAAEPDPLTEAFAQGFAAGHEQARGEAEARAAADAAAHEGLMLSFARLDATLEEELRFRLRDTVVALCEAALAPLAVDADALMRRIDRAAAMLARADDDRVIYLHPDDLALVSPRLSSEWHVQPQARLERGTIRVETASGGVEDGPTTWRLAIAEALHQC